MTTTTATALDIVERLADSPYQWTTLDMVGRGMGDKQVGHAEAISAAVNAGLVRRVTIRGKACIQLTATVVDMIRVGDTAVIVTDQPDSYVCRYGIDTWALPTPEESDPELADWARRPAGQPFRIDQDGCDALEDVDRLLSDAALV